jgi:hypothetical protein
MAKAPGELRAPSAILDDLSFAESYFLAEGDRALPAEVADAP